MEANMNLFTEKASPKKTKLHRLVYGKKYRLLKDYTDLIYGVIPKDVILTFIGPNLGYAKFRFGSKDIAIKPTLAFKILEEVKP